MDNRTQAHSGWAIFFRYISGRPLDGYRRTDSNFLHPGTRSLNQTGVPSRWELLPGWKRAAWRVLPPAALVFLLVFYLLHPVLTIVLGCVALAGGLAYGIWRVRIAIRNWQHRRTYVIPLHETLARVFDHHPKSAPDYLDVQPRFHHVDTPTIRITLPRGFNTNPEGRKVIQQIAADKLALYDFTAQWHTVGLRSSVTFHRAPRPRDRVTYTDILSEIEAANDAAPVLGLAAGDKAVTMDLEAESPHVLISAGSGGGKSVMVRTLLAQGLARGAQAVILDPKRHSHRWAKDLPNVVYCRDTEEIHRMLLHLADEGQRRNVIADEHGDQADVGPRIYVIAEEMNAMADRLATYWKENREKGDPMRSPAVAALNEILFMGRAVRINVVAVAQMMTAQALGGPAARENFATRVLARYSSNNWKMLVPEIAPIPRSSRHPGRVQVCNSGVARETQVAFLSESEARELAQAGWNATDAPQVPQLASKLADQVKQPVSPVAEVEPVAGLRLVDDPDQELVSLAQAVESGVIPMGLAAVRTARARDVRFPQPAATDGQTQLYRVGDLAAWLNERVPA